MPVEYLTPAIEDRAVEVQAILAERGHHRGPSIPDLLLAATAELARLTGLHVDHDYELIAEVTGQPHERLRDRRARTRDGRRPRPQRIWRTPTASPHEASVVQVSTCSRWASARHSRSASDSPSPRRQRAAAHSASSAVTSSMTRE